MPAFLKTLREEHSYFSSLLQIVSEQRKFIADGNEVDFQILQDALRYLSEYPEDYHHPREDLLFDRLQSKVGQRSGKMLTSLLRGHEQIHKESIRLYFTVMRANNGEDVRRSKLAEDLGFFVDAYDKHMRDEDDVIFRRALEVLDKDDWEALDEGMEKVEDPLFGTRVRRRYRHLANVLETRLGVAKRDLVIAEYLSLGAVIDNLVTISEAAAGLGMIVLDHTGQTFRENMSAARDTVGSGNIGKVARLPFALGGNAIKHLRSGFTESRELVSRAIDDVRTPYAMRVDTLKDILREDWDL